MAGTIKYATLALKTEKYKSEFLIPILKYFLSQNSNGLDEVVDYLNMIYDLNNRKDLYFLLKHTRISCLYILEDKLKEYLSEDEKKQIYYSAE